MSDDTQAGQAPDEPTTGLPTTAADAPDLAWSLDGDDTDETLARPSQEPSEPISQPWRTTFGLVGVIAACSAALAIAAGASLWAMRSGHNDVIPLPPAAKQTVTSSVSEPAPVTSTVTQTVTQTPKPTPTATVTTPTTTERMTPDSEFLSLIREQYTVKDAGQAIWLGHEVCRRLAVESDVDVLHYLTNTYNAPRDEALGLESAAMTIYCPQFLGR